jgi:murein DD-endopeptidase MepM/ murein hydrolase activator NlpD
MEALLQDKNLKRICIVILFSLWAWSVFGGTTAAGDSLGLKTIEGKSFIVYQVSKGETAYAVSRRYSIPFKEIEAANSGVDLGALKAGQQILVPTVFTPAPVVAGSTQTQPVSSPENLTGQAADPVQQPNLSETVVETNPESAAQAEENGQEMIESGDSQEGGQSFAMIYGEYSSAGGIAAFEKGVATWIEDNGIQPSGDRYYALHNSAPLGSVVKVRNLMNNRIIYAKVIGRLSESEVNAKVLIKLSAGAGERLNVLDNRFVVEITWFLMEENQKAAD